MGTCLSRPGPGLVPLDIRDVRGVREEFYRWRPAWVIHTAAKAGVDDCEIDREGAYELNVTGTRNVAMATGEVGAKLAFISTDYVFDGNSGPYSEDDRPSPINYYGWTKLRGEEVVAKSSTDSLILRTSWVYSCEKERVNFVSGLIESNRQGRAFMAPHDQYGTPISSHNLAEAGLDLIQGEARGVYHLAGTRFIDRYSFSLLAADLLGLNRDLISSVPSGKLRQAAPRPRRAGLKVEKALGRLKVKLASPEEGLKILRERLNERADNQRAQ